MAMGKNAVCLFSSGVIVVIVLNRDKGNHVTALKQMLVSVPEVPEVIYRPNIIEISGVSALAFMRDIHDKNLKIIDFGGATKGHLHYAHTVADLWDHSAWYNRYFPKTRFIARADVTRKLPITDNEFDYVWTSHVAEHVPDPKLFCAEMSRISKYGGVICVPRPLADNLIEPLHNIKYGHKWWLFHNDTHLQFMSRQKLLIHGYQNKMRNYNGFMRNFFGASWEMCIVFQKHLQCDIIEPMFENWSSNVLPLKFQKPQTVQLKL